MTGQETQVMGLWFWARASELPLLDYKNTETIPDLAFC